MEAALPKALASSAEAKEVDYSDVLARWQRQYVGLTRGTQRFIYGNYFPAEDDYFPAEHHEMWHDQPVITCDGGPRYFGAEFYPAAGRITRIDFNGSLAAPSATLPPHLERFSRL